MKSPNWNPLINLETPALREVTLRVNAVGGINLGQGICLMPAPPAVLEAAQEAIRAGKNLYSPAVGVPELREGISKKLKTFNKLDYSSDQVVVTAGEIGAFEAVCQALLQPGDEVVSFIPYYPYHHNLIKRRGAVARYVTLNAPDWKYDPHELRSAFNKKTKLVVLNTPNNPTGKVFSKAELTEIGALCQEYDIPCVTDEVYEYMTFDGHQHTSMATIPGMYERTITTSSCSKTFAITGWRIGYMAAPAAMINVLRIVYDQIYVCAPTPLQHGVAQGLKVLGPEYYSWLSTEYSRKRELLAQALKRAGITYYLPQGSYFMVADTRERFPGLSSEEVVDLLIDKAKVGAVPASDFVGSQAKGDPKKSYILRFCFGVPDELLHRCAENLARVG